MRRPFAWDYGLHHHHHHRKRHLKPKIYDPRKRIARSVMKVQKRLHCAEFHYNTLSSIRSTRIVCILVQHGAHTLDTWPISKASTMRCEMATNICKHLGALEWVSVSVCDAMGNFLKGKSIDAALYRSVHTFVRHWRANNMKKKKTKKRITLPDEIVPNRLSVCRFASTNVGTNKNTSISRVQPHRLVHINSFTFFFIFIDNKLKT